MAYIATRTLIIVIIAIIILLAVILERMKRTINEMIFNMQNRKRKKVRFSKEVVFDFLQKEGCKPEMNDTDIPFTYNENHYIVRFDDADTEYCILMVYTALENMDRGKLESIATKLNREIKLFQIEIADEGLIGRIEFYADSLGYFTHYINRFITIIDYAFSTILEEYKIINERERISVVLKESKRTKYNKPIN